MSAGAALAQVTQRVSVSSSGAQANNWSAFPAISGDGRFVAFQSPASNLVPGDTNATDDIFVRDRLLGTTERVSVSSSGAQGNDSSGGLFPVSGPAISADGRCVAFVSSATNLVAGDTNGIDDAFVRDRWTGITERISVASSGLEADGGSSALSISADGRYVAFVSSATNLVPGDTNHTADVFVRDRQNMTTECIDVDPSGAEVSEGAYEPWISADGRYVVFESTAPNLVAGDTNGTWDVFLRDRTTGTTERVSVDSSGAQANGSSGPATVSADGRYVAFLSAAGNLVARDTNGKVDAFVRDRLAHTTERISVGAGGAEADDSSWCALISDDGRWVAFLSDATNLVPGDTNAVRDLFLRDRESGTTERLDLDWTGTARGPVGDDPALSSDGGCATFMSSQPLDAQGPGLEIFVRDRFGGTNFTSLCDPGAGGVVVCPCANPPGGSGRGCDNSASTGGAMLLGAGGTYLSSDTLVFTTSGETSTATSVLLQGTSSPASGLVYGQGVRCVGGALLRLFTKTASGGSITVPDYSGGDPTVSARSAAKGNPISAGQSRWYLVFYRDPIVLGGCSSASTFNATQTGLVTWSP